MKMPITLMLLLVLTSCSTVGPVPDALMRCEKWGVPDPKTIRRDSDVIDYIESGRAINATCYANMNAIRTFEKGRKP